MECCGRQSKEERERSVANLNQFITKAKNRKLFESIREKLLSDCCDVPFTCDGQNLMVHSPVGNHSKFIKSSKKAKIMLSGYCTAPEAAKRYLVHLADGTEPEKSECENGFGTGTMKDGITKSLLPGIGFSEDEAKQIFDCSKDIECYDEKLPLFLFTQMLCMISRGESAAKDVTKALKESASIRRQASLSLGAWLERIRNGLEPSGIILLMGEEAKNLLENSYVDEEGNVEIRFESDGGLSLQAYIQEAGYTLLPVIHAAAWEEPFLREWRERRNSNAKKCEKALRKKGLLK